MTALDSGPRPGRANSHPLSDCVVGARRQWQLISRLPDYWLDVAVSPVLALLLVAVVTSLGRDDLGATAVVGAATMSSWQTGVFLAGDTLARDRQFGILELTLAAPVDPRFLVLGRLVTTVCFSLTPYLTSLVTATLVFGGGILHGMDVAAFGVSVLASSFALTGALLCLSSIALLSGRSTAIVNGVSYPLYLLSGVLVPVSHLPEWLRLISNVSFLRWSADASRAAARDGELLLPALAALLGLGWVMLVFGAWLNHRTITRMRCTGEVIFQ